MTEEELRLKAKNYEPADWYHCSYIENLSEDFIREFADKVRWSSISYNQNLSENFIAEFETKVSWAAISEKQNISEEFIEKFKDKICWDYLFYNKKRRTKKFVDRFKDKIVIRLVPLCFFPNVKHESSWRQFL